MASGSHTSLAVPQGVHNTSKTGIGMVNQKSEFIVHSQTWCMISATGPGQSYQPGGAAGRQKRLRHRSRLHPRHGPLSNPMHQCSVRVHGCCMLHVFRKSANSMRMCLKLADFIANETQIVECLKFLHMDAGGACKDLIEDLASVAAVQIHLDIVKVVSVSSGAGGACKDHGTGWRVCHVQARFHGIKPLG